MGNGATGGAVKRAWRRFRGIPLWLQIVAWVVLVGVIVAAASSDDKGDQEVTSGPTSVAPVTTPETTAAPSTTPAPTTTAAPATTRATTSTTAAGPKTSFGSGTHRVGTDIAPGTYRATGGSTCYWARLSGFGGSVGDVIANNLGGGSQVVAIAASDAGFESRNCGTWTLT